MTQNNTSEEMQSTVDIIPPNPWFRGLIIGSVLIIAYLSHSLFFVPLAEWFGVNSQTTPLAGARMPVNITTISLTLGLAIGWILLIFLIQHSIHRQPVVNLGFKHPIIQSVFSGFSLGIFIAGLPLFFEFILSGKQSEISWNLPTDVSSISFVGYYFLWFIPRLLLISLREELIFRSYPIEQFRDKPAIWQWSLIVVLSLAFSSFHLVLEPFILIIFFVRFLFSLLASCIYLTRRSIWIIAGLHTGINFIHYSFFGTWENGGLFAITNRPVFDGYYLPLTALTYAVAIAIIWKREFRKDIRRIIS